MIGEGKRTFKKPALQMLKFHLSDFFWKVILEEYSQEKWEAFYFMVTFKYVAFS